MSCIDVPGGVYFIFYSMPVHVKQYFLDIVKSLVTVSLARNLAAIETPSSARDTFSHSLTMDTEG